MIAPLLIASLATGLTLIYASYLDIRERRVPFRTWYPMLAVSVPLALWTYASLIRADPRTALGYLLLVALFCALFYIFAAYLHLFGGADAWALIFITATIPLFPLVPALGIPLTGFFPLSVLVNAVILNLLAPVALFFLNIIRNNHAPLQYMFIGFPVDGTRIGEAFGFVMEEFDEHDGVLSRRFIGFREALQRMVSGERRMYTQDMKRFPEEYQYERALYSKAGKVWISYGVPFIVPITAGFFTALFMGDILVALMQTLAGV
jgi:preflagellin peptidase FlaK